MGRPSGCELKRDCTCAGQWGCRITVSVAIRLSSQGLGSPLWAAPSLFLSLFQPLTPILQEDLGRLLGLTVGGWAPGRLTGKRGAS